MKKNRIILATIGALLSITTACKKETVEPVPANPKLIFVFDFDSTQVRLDNFGNPATLPSGHAGQSPQMNTMVAHYIELVPNASTQIGNGKILYQALETTAAGEKAIHFDKSKLTKNGERFFETPIKELNPGEYDFLRVSLAYQNYDVRFLIDTNIAVQGQNYAIYGEQKGTVASFIGYNTYITSLLVKEQQMQINGNKKQGFWAFESSFSAYNNPIKILKSGQAPAGFTTVVNPLHATSPIPSGSCLVTGGFGSKQLRITGKETKDIVVHVSLSTNKSFEWEEVIHDGKWEPGKNERVVDMGIRGMKLQVQD